MAGENISKTTGQPKNYKFDRGGMPTEFGPFIGIVKNNVDSTRTGRLQVYIEQFGGADPNNKDLWRYVNYCPPFYGATPKGGSAGTGTFVQGNQQSYGMWFTPPDIGVSVLCFFVGGDPKLGYYVGCIPDQGIIHMIPAIGAVDKAQATTQNKEQASYFAGATRLPVTEINNSNLQIADNPKYFDQPKPVHSYVAGILFQQGLINDKIRGSIASSSQRESPSNCYGISTPGRPIYQGGIGAQGGDENVNSQSLASNKPADANVIGRRGGHTFVMDDGNLQGQDNLIRIRTSKGHQITMSDDGDCFYISHANGQAWVELGKEGTLDVYTTNSVNLRTQGTINLHADEDINMFAGGKINMKSTGGTIMQSDTDMSISNKGKMTLFSQGTIGIKSPGTVAIDSQLGSWASGSELSFNGSKIQLNGGPKTAVDAPPGLTKYLHPKVEFNSSAGWVAEPSATESIVTRAPTHEPYPYHNQGVSVSVEFSGAPTPPPDAPAVPEGVKITKTGNAASTAAAAAGAKSTTNPGGTTNAAPNLDPNSVTWDPNSRVSMLAANDQLMSMQVTVTTWLADNSEGDVSSNPQWQAASRLSDAISARLRLLSDDVNKLMAKSQ